MTLVSSARNVNDALGRGIDVLLECGLREDTRNGPVISAPAPVVTETLNPMERVLFSPLRDANPFFHLMESLWMLAGRNDLPWLARFNKRMAEYSDDGGETQPGAYGYRWRQHFGYDQLDEIVRELSVRPESRRAVLAMWDGGALGEDSDLLAAMSGSKDVPCNTHCYFRLLDGRLHMTVCCRSNDAVWGAHGANAVHFSILQEYLATRIGAGVGTMTQFSHNYHIYTGAIKADLPALARDAQTHNFYVSGADVNTTRIFNEPMVFDAELPEFMEWAGQDGDSRPEPAFATSFFQSVAAPMVRAWDLHKVRDYEGALERLKSMPPGCDWRVACAAWLNRRAVKRGVA